MKILSLYRHHRGFALTEVLLSIAVIVIVGIASYPLYKSAHLSSEVDVLAGTLTESSIAIKKLYSNSNDFSAIGTLSSNAGLIQLETSGMLPSNIEKHDDGNYYVNGYQIMTEMVGPTATIKPSQFYLGFRSLTPELCTKLVLRMAPLSVGVMGDSASMLIKGGPLSANYQGKVDIEQLNKVCQPYPTGTRSLWFGN